MKSEHRHELQTNELGRIVDQVGAWFEKYANQIMIAACVVSLAAAGIIYWTRSTRSHAAAAWRDLASATRAEDYAAVWETHPGTTAAEWARVQEGEARLTEAVQLSFSNLESARKELQRARDVLQAAVNQKSTLPEIRERALYALGRCLETMSDGNEADAAKAYQALVREFPNSIFRRDAESRIADLDSNRGQEFYAWFATYLRPKTPELRPRDKSADDPEDKEDLHLDSDDAADSPGPAAGKASDPADKNADGPRLKLLDDTNAPSDAPAEGKKPGADSSTPPPP